MGMHTGNGHWRGAGLAGVLALALLGAAAPAVAVGEFGSVVQQDLFREPGFLRWHPDMRYQRSGVERWERGDDRGAYQDFLEASRYGNKLAQAMVGEMLWTGQGVGQDRAAAYAWMDLAAERRYPALLAIRERYWNQLDADERARALEVGKEIYAEYSDAAAVPRLSKLLRRGKRQSTGSRLGANTAAIDVYTDIRPSALDAFRGPFGPGSSAAWQPNYYDPRYWVPERYIRFVNRLQGRMPEGTVSVLPPRRDRRGD